MPTKKGNGGHGPENYDPNTGRYIGDSQMSRELMNVMNLSNQDVVDEELKDKYKLSMEEIQKNREIDKQKQEQKKLKKENKESKVFDEEIENAGNSLYEKFQKQEPQISSNIISFCENLGGIMYGIDHKLKTPESIKSKINRDVRKWNDTIKNSAESITDGIRYTCLFPTDKFTDSSLTLINNLEKNGYQIETIKNRFYDSEGNVNKKYRDIKIVLRNNDGTLFELQLNTIKGVSAKEGKEYKDNKFVYRSDGVLDSHSYYKELIDLPFEEENSERGRYLQYMMEKIWNEVPVPKDVEKIGMTEENKNE